MTCAATVRARTRARSKKRNIRKEHKNRNATARRGGPRPQPTGDQDRGAEGPAEDPSPEGGGVHSPPQRRHTDIDTAHSA